MICETIFILSVTFVTYIPCLCVKSPTQASVFYPGLLTLSSLCLPPASHSRLTLQQKEAELTKCLEQERRTKNQLQDEVTTKDAQLHELEVKVKTQRERTKSLTEQVSDVLHVC